MKFPLFLLSLLLLAALVNCSEDKEKTEDLDSTSTEDNERPNPYVALVREKIALQQQLESIIAKADVGTHQELQEVKDEAKEADRHFYTLQRQHPKLQKLYKKAAILQNRRSSGNTLPKADVAAAIMEINTEIAKVSATIPEIRTAKSSQAKARRAILDKKRELARDLPEAQAILSKLAEIDAQLVDPQP